MDITPSGFNSRGSFGIPDQLRNQLEGKPGAQPEQKSASAPAQDTQATVQEPVATAPQETKAPEDAEDQAQKDVRALREFWEKRLQVQITERDVRDYIFKGRLIKDGVEVIPGYMKASFQSLNPEELGIIDQKMATFRETTKFTADGLSNENALQVLSYGWLRSVEIDGGSAKAPKSMGNTPEERYKTISKISALAVQEAIEAWDGFNTLLKVALKEKQLLKKY